MIDINIIRNNRKLVEENIKKKFQDSKLKTLDLIEELDKKLRKVKLEGDTLRQNRNEISDEIGMLFKDKKIDEANKQKEKVEFKEKHKLGTITVPNHGKLNIKKVDKITEDGLCYDADCIPRDAEWRYRRNGDVFEKFGGGTKKLKSYLIDKKYPARLRENLPVLASGNEILIIAGLEISNKVKVTHETKRIYKVTKVNN